MPPVIEDEIKATARGLGFDLVGICALGPADTAARFTEWIERGCAGHMSYLARNADVRVDSRAPVPGTTHAIVVALNYGGTEPRGPIARYARGTDYHDVMLDKLEALHEWVRTRVGRPVPGKAYVDTGPLLERDLGRRAGLGWFGKNTNLLNPQLGSFFFLGALVLQLELTPDPPFDADRCGSCTRCLDACPTDAFLAPRVLDATRCISYLTIELRGAIPLAYRSKIGELLYGCDICQDVCPWNIRFSRALTEPLFEPRTAITTADPREFLHLSQPEFETRFRGSAMKRAKRAGLARNAAIVLGNRGDPEDIDPLAHAIEFDPDPAVRSHAAWALGEIARQCPSHASRIRDVLRSLCAAESDAMVLAEVAAARRACTDEIE